MASWVASSGGSGLARAAPTAAQAYPRSTLAARERGEVPATLLEAAVLVVGGGCRREQDHVARAGGAAGGGDGVLDIAAVVQRDAGRLERGAQLRRRLADQVRGR